MNEQATARTLYKKLLSLYPRRFKDQLGESMEQTFNDLYNEKRQTKKELFGFVLSTFTETATGIVQEHILLLTQGDVMKHIATNPNLAAFVGLLFITPFVLLTTISGNRVEPFFSLLRQVETTGPFEYILPFSVLILIPVGSFIAIRPIFQKEAEGKRKFYPVNVLLAALLLILFVILFLSLGSVIYTCDILQIACD